MSLTAEQAESILLGVTMARYNRDGNGQAIESLLLVYGEREILAGMADLVTVLLSAVQGVTGTSAEEALSAIYKVARESLAEHYANGTA